MFPLLETIRIENGAPMNLEWHQLRMNESFAEVYKTETPLRLERILSVPDQFSSGTVKCRLLYNAWEYEVKFEPYRVRNVQTLQLVEIDQLEYSLKYSNRSEIDQLVKLKGACDDILIVKEGVITDTSYTNILFYIGEQWVTPARPLLKGTCRNRLLNTGIIAEKEITPDDLGFFNSFMLINAMMDFEEGRAVGIEGIVRGSSRRSDR